MKKLSILVIMIFLLLYIVPLGIRPIVDPDESRYGQIASEMLDSGNFIVPRLNGLRYFEKPVLGYWMNAASIDLFGENAFAIRFTSALATGLTALLIILIGSSFAGGWMAGIISAMIYLTCIEVFCLSVFSVLDPLFTFFSTAAMVLFFYGYSSPDDSRNKTAF